MRKAVGIVVLVVTASLFFVFTANAYAFNNSTTPCSSCHSGPGVSVAASPVSTTTTTASYSVLVTGGTAWAVFDGATRVGGALGTTGDFIVAPGKTYNVFATASTKTGGLGVASVSPSAPPVVPPTTDDTTTPTTTSDAKTSYPGAAIVHLTGTDNVGGSGVAYIYYSIDRGPVHLMMLPVLDTSVTIAAPTSGSLVHTLTFWSQDNFGNVEAPKTATFTVAAAAVAKKPTSTTLRCSAATITHGHYVTLTAHVKGGTFAAGTVVRFEVKRPGSSRYVGLKVVRVNSDGVATYRYKVYAKGNNWHRVRFFGNATYLPAPIKAGLRLHVN